MKTGDTTITRTEFRIVENALKFVISHEFGCAGNEVAEDCVQDFSIYLKDRVRIEGHDEPTISVIFPTSPMTFGYSSSHHWCASKSKVVGTVWRPDHLPPMLSLEMLNQRQ